MKWLALFFTLFILAVIILADEGLLGPLRRFYAFPYGDKAGHFILYGLLALILNLYFLARPHANSKRLVLAVGLVLAILIGLEEWSQSRFPSRAASCRPCAIPLARRQRGSRAMDGVDLLFSYAGVAVFSWIAYMRYRPLGSM